MSEGSPRIFVGWDSRQDDAYRVCRHSMLRHSRRKPSIEALRQDALRRQGLYWRDKDPLASTEFTYTRFLVPHLMEHTGWALFLDCDFLITADVTEVFRLADERRAVLCVQHEYEPCETVKMDGVAQTTYPRKNWSSFVLWNCGHPANAILTPEVVNSATGAYLHRFAWLTDEEIGALPAHWNWLEGWNHPTSRPPAGIHFTRGGPWFERWQDVTYADLWWSELQRVESGPEETDAAGFLVPAPAASRRQGSVGPSPAPSPRSGSRP